MSKNRVDLGAVNFALHYLYGEVIGRSKKTQRRRRTVRGNRAVVRSLQAITGEPCDRVYEFPLGSKRRSAAVVPALDSCQMMAMADSMASVGEEGGFDLL